MESLFLLAFGEEKSRAAPAMTGSEAFFNKLLKEYSASSCGKLPESSPPFHSTLQFTFLSRRNRRFCRRYKQTIVRSAKECQHEDRQLRRRHCRLCFRVIRANMMRVKQLVEFVS